MPASDEITQSSPVKKWLNHQCSVASVTADFTQQRKLKALKRPIVNEGQLWFKSPRLFRWEVGRPAKSIAISREGDLHLLRPAKKTVERIFQTGSKKRNRSSEMLFFELGFPESHDAFAEKFTVTDVTIQDGSFFFTVNAKDIRTNLALRKIVFQVDSEGLFTQNITLRFRDSSSIVTTFSNVREDVAVKDSVFKIDLTGYTIKEDG